MMGYDKRSYLTAGNGVNTERWDNNVCPLFFFAVGKRNPQIGERDLFTT